MSSWKLNLGSADTFFMLNQSFTLLLKSLPSVAELESPRNMAFPLAILALYNIRVVNAREVSEIIVNITSQTTRHFNLRDDLLLVGLSGTTSMYIGSKHKFLVLVFALS